MLPLIQTQDHYLLLRDTFPNFSLKPKHHFILHYPHLIRSFGPLVALWSMRFDSKHSVFKRIAHDLINTKNLQVSLGRKHQQFMAYYLDGQSLFQSNFYIKKISTVHIESLNSSQKSAVSRKYPYHNTVCLTSKVQLFGTEYAEGMVVLAGQCYGQPEFFMIVSIIVNADKVSFLSKKAHSMVL